MAWRDVMLAAMRLVDLFDTRRELGGSVSSVRVPARASSIEDKSAGIFFDLGTALLESLDALEGNAPGTYLLAQDVFNDLYGEFPECDLNDFHNVVQKLSVRYPIFFAREGVVLKDTALIERAPAGKRIRLSRKGRLALYLSESSSDWIYLDLEAKGITRAIDLGKFGDVERFSREIMKRAKDANLEIRSILEMPFAELQAQALYTKNDLYLETVSKTQGIVSEALHLLSGENVLNALDEWIGEHPDQEGIDRRIRDQLYNTLSIIETLTRNLSDILSVVQKGGQTGVRTPNFQAAAKVAVLKVAGDKIMSSALRMFVHPAGPHESIQDLVNPFVAPEEKLREPMVVDMTSAELVVTDLYAFGERYGEEFMSRLSHGPVSLIQLIEEGACGAHDFEALPELVGAILDSESMGLNGEYFVTPGKEIRSFEIDGNSIEIQDLVIQAKTME